MLAFTRTSKETSSNYKNIHVQVF